MFFDLTYILCTSVFTSITYFVFISNMFRAGHLSFNVYMTGASVMHEAGYVDSIWSILYHFSFGYLHLVHLSLFGKSSWLMHVNF